MGLADVNHGGRLDISTAGGTETLVLLNNGSGALGAYQNVTPAGSSESGPFRLPLVLFSRMGTARLVRAQVLSLREAEFIWAARAAGVGGWRLAWRHLLPHCLGPVLVAAAGAVGTNVLYESALNFLGLGIPPPVPSWGGMLQSARVYGYYRAPWLIYSPGLCITAAVFAVNVLADRWNRERGASVP